MDRHCVYYPQRSSAAMAASCSILKPPMHTVTRRVIGFAGRACAPIAPLQSTLPTGSPRVQRLVAPQRATAGDEGAVVASASEETARKSSFSQAVFNVLNILMGVGLLSIPFALSRSGWFGLFILWGLGVVTNYTGKALVECSAKIADAGANGETKQTRRAGYEEIAEGAFGSFGKRIISSIIYIELLGTCALLMILEGNNLSQLVGSQIPISAKNFILLAALIVVPTTWLPDLSALSYLGFCGFAATMMVTVSIIYTLLSGSFLAGAETALLQPATVPLVFGILAFVYAGHGVFPAIQASMQKPQDFPRVLNTAYVIAASTCTILGAAGYFMYGSAVPDVVIYALNNGWLKTLCCSLILVNPLAKFALTLEPVAQTVEGSKREPGSDSSDAVLQDNRPSRITALAVRTGLALACVAAARFLPFLAYVMALVGSFLTISVSVVFPALCHLQLFQDASTPRKLWNLLVVAVGVVCALSGTAASLQSLAAAA